MKILVFLISLLSLSEVYSQQIDFSACHDALSYKERKDCAELNIYTNFIAYIDSQIASEVLKNTSSFLADFKLFHTDGERVHLITLLCDTPEMTPIISDFFSSQEAIPGIRNDSGLKTELTWTERLEFKKTDIGFTAEPTNKTIVYYETFPIHPGCASKSNKKMKQCFSKKVQQLIKKELTKDFIRTLKLPPGRKRISVFFAINEEGNLTRIRVRAPHPDLERRVQEILNKLPSMEPGTKSNLPVEVQFALPILFEVNS